MSYSLLWMLGQRAQRRMKCDQVPSGDNFLEKVENTKEWMQTLLS